MPTVTNLIGLGMPPEQAVEVSNGTFTTGVRTIQSVDNVTDALPTQAEMVAAFGAAATVGSGFIGVIKDNDADTNFFICASNGTSFYALKMTKGA